MKKLTVVLLTTALLIIGTNATAALITNISQPTYARDSLNLGVQHYVDRPNFWMTSIPDKFKGLDMIRTANTLNNDRNNSDPIWLTFDLQSDAIVYVAYDSRAISPPNWLTAAGWSASITGIDQDSIGTNDTSLDIYMKEFVAGVPGPDVELGGNKATGSFFPPPVQGSMYIVFAESSIPEPSVMLLIGSGLIGLAVYRRKYRK